MKRTHKIVAGLAGGLSLVVFAAFAAGPGAGMGMNHGMWTGMGGMGMMHGAGPGMMAAQDLTQVKTQLAITPEQEAAWQAYADKAGAQTALMQAMHAQRHQAANADTSAPDRMTQHMALMQQGLAGMQAMSAALTDLYAVLTPEQRTIADQQLGHRGPMGHRGQGGRGNRS